MADTPSEALPPRETALRELARRHARALAWLGVRTVGAGLVLVAVVGQAPGAARHLGWLEAVAALLAAAPYFTALGRVHAWRIALGRSYARAEQWEDAAVTLAPLTGVRARMFDSTGEGRYWLALALLRLGRDGEARAHFREVVADARPDWREKAQLELGEGTPA
jgi:hypothetical protein